MTFAYFSICFLFYVLSEQNLAFRSDPHLAQTGPQPYTFFEKLLFPPICKVESLENEKITKECMVYI